MKSVRRAATGVAMAAGLVAISACISTPEPPSADTTTAAPTVRNSSTATSPATVGHSSRGPGASAEPQPSASQAKSTSEAQPVPKVERSGAPRVPSATARPTSVSGTVRYPDGISLKVVSVRYGKETQRGPGSFPGRPFAVLRLEVVNHSSYDLSMATTVVTVLDRNGEAAAPVYAAEAKVADFAGTLSRGRTLRASYAFAVPTSSRSRVTVVVDFDGAHTSAVFRGKLS